MSWVGKAGPLMARKVGYGEYCMHLGWFRVTPQYMDSMCTPSGQNGFHRCDYPPNPHNGGSRYHRIIGLPPSITNDEQMVLPSKIRISIISPIASIVATYRSFQFEYQSSVDPNLNILFVWYDLIFSCRIYPHLNLLILKSSSNNLQTCLLNWLNSSGQIFSTTLTLPFKDWWGDFSSLWYYWLNSL